MSHRVLGEPPEASPTPLAKKQKTALRAFFISSWLGMRDSNPRMVGPEPTALPLGESRKPPILAQKFTLEPFSCALVCKDGVYVKY